MVSTPSSQSLLVAAVASALVTLFTSGCTDRTSISSMSAAVDVVIADGMLRASASLVDGAEPYITDPSDRLSVTVRDQTIELTYNESNEIYYGRPYYGAGALTQAVATDEPVAMTLVRGEDTGSIVGTAPTELVLDGPAAIASGTDLVISWSPSSDPMKWYARDRNGDASDQGTIDNDNGTMTFPHDVIATLCMPDEFLELKLQRFRSAQQGGGFAGGNVTVRRFASAEILVTR